MKVLITGFDIFAGGTINPSWEMIKNLPSSLGEHTLIIEKLPVVYSTIENELESLITLNKPDLIIMFGLDEGVPYPKVESYGWNHAGTYPDNDGVVLNAPLVNNADTRIGYEVPYNYYDVLRWIGNNDFDIRLSLDGGSYLCNAAIYYTGYILEQKGLDTPYFFSHVPNVTNLSIVDAEKYAMLIIQGMVNEKSHHKIDFNLAYNTATTSVDGLMSSTDKVKLNSVETGAQVNRTVATQAQAEAGTDNNTMVTPLRAKQAIQKLAPTPPLASTSANGLMSSSDKTKLDGIQASPSIASQLEALTGTNNTNMMTPLRTKEVILESATIVVNHGTNSSMARPSGASVVYWIGTVEPTNATNNDLWVGGL